MSRKSRRRHKRRGKKNNQQQVQVVSTRLENPQAIKALAKRLDRTPDAAELRYNRHHILFVYDDFMINGDHNQLLHTAGNEYLGKATTTTDTYCMKMGRQPVAFFRDRSQGLNHGYIKGDVFKVTTQTLQSLDEIMYNMQIFKREQKFVLAHDQEVAMVPRIKRPHLKAHIYLGIEEFWDDMVMQSMSRMRPAQEPHKWFYAYDPATKALREQGKTNYYGQYGNWDDERWQDMDMMCH